MPTKDNSPPRNHGGLLASARQLSSCPECFFIAPGRLSPNPVAFLSMTLVEDNFSRWVQLL
jgi:hypothetical protein